MSEIENANRESLLELVWAKSNAGGQPHSLPGHLMDAVAVAELIWDQFMAPGFRRRIDDCCDGRGRDVFRLACGWHDVGKASPAFQSIRCDLAADLCKRADLPDLQRLSKADRDVSHGNAGRVIIQDYLLSTGANQWSWLAVMLEGHHGYFRSYSQVGRSPSRTALGRGNWALLQQGICSWVEEEIGFRIAEVNGDVPSRSLQLQLAGFVVMADWIASCDLFPGLGLGHTVSLSAARQRAMTAWAALGLRGGWDPAVLPQDFAEQFGLKPRQFQDSVINLAQSMENPGLMVVEAPMGEGKTEAALAAISILAKRFGCDGWAFAMPTQGTTDAMYERCRAWAESIDPSFPIALVHGKAMMNEEWRRRLDEARQKPKVCGVYDEYDMPDDYGTVSVEKAPVSVVVPADWLLYRHRPMLSSGVMMTVDHLLYAGTKTKFVMLRHAGLAGKVVVIDEVHSYDIFMETFLDEVLKWLGQAGVPVILMSATLTPDQRDRLMRSYAPGVEELPSTSRVGYPLTTFIEATGSKVQQVVASTWRPDQAVAVEVLGDASKDVDAISRRILADMADGGCALAIMNTVTRAQELARSLRAVGQAVLLIHGRLTVRERADRTARAVDLLGKDKTRDSGRPHSLVIVATQIAEQSFDVDADILYTDIAPMDLLLQRIGRLHRHDRPLADRPVTMRRPRVIVTGVSIGESGCVYPQAFGQIQPRNKPTNEGRRGVYHPWALLRTAAALRQATCWQIPGDVPALVEQAYAQSCPWVPNEWQSQEEIAAEDRLASELERQVRARSFGLSQGSYSSSDLQDLHNMATKSGDESIIVRDGEPTLEVCLVVQRGDSFETLSGRPLGPTGERTADDPVITREVLGDSVRVWETGGFCGLAPLPGWGGMLRRQRALVLKPDLSVDLKDCRVSYDKEYGLSIEWKRLGQ